MHVPLKASLVRLALSLMIGIFALTPMMGFSASAATAPPLPYTILVDNRAIPFDVPPMMRNRRILVPFRAIAESLGIDLTWDQATRTVHASGYGKKVSLQVGNLSAQVNGTAVTLDVAPFILNKRTLIPIRFFSEAFGCGVLWDGPKQTVRITSPLKAMEISAWYAMDGNWNGLFAADYPNTSIGGTDAIGTIIFGWHEMNEAGMLITNGTKGWKKPVGWENALAAAKQHQLRTDLCAYMTDGTGALTRLMANPYAWQNAANSLVAGSTDYNGVNLDMEGLGLTDVGAQLTTVRQQFTAFVRLVSKNLHAAGKTLTLTLHPSNSSYKGYDYAALAPLADRIVLMAYDYGQKPEPYLSVEKAIIDALALVPKEKLVLGISFASESPESLLTKLGLAKRHKLAGVALWRLGLMVEGDWTALRSSVQPIR